MSKAPYIEYGFLLTVGILSAFWLLCCGSIAITVLMIYYIVLFATDNVSIYFDVVLFVFVMAFALSATERNERYGLQNSSKQMMAKGLSRWRRYRLVPA